MCGFLDLFEFRPGGFNETKHFLIKDFSFKTIVLASVGRRSRAGNLSQNIPNQNNFYLNRIRYLPATCVKGWLPHKEEEVKLLL